MLAVSWPGDFVIDISNPAAQDLKTATGTINVSTNNATGYTLTAEIDGTTNDLTNTYDASYTISNLESSATASNFPVNHWGYAIDTLDTFSPFPTPTATTINVKTTTGPMALSTTDFSIATKVNADLASGDYTNKIKFSAVTNELPPEPETSACSDPIPSGPTYMQDFNLSTDKAKMTQEAQYKLIDKRDNKPYCVSLLKDGKVWMTQNLDFDITGEKLTSADTNLVDTTEWTPDHTTIPKDQVSTWENTTTSPRSYDPGGEEGEYIFTSNSTSNDTIYTSLEACTEAGHTASECLHYSSGNLYNWTAAKATNNPTSQTAYASSSHDSICPKGWTLPSANSAAPSEFGTMLNAQGIISSTTSESYASGGFNKVRTAPLYWVRAGAVNDSSRGKAGFRGHYWSSTAYGSDSAYFVDFISSGIFPRSTISRDLGHSVRCIAL